MPADLVVKNGSKMLGELACDVLLLDLGLPGTSGVKILQEVRARRPDIAVVVLSVYPRAQYAARIVRAGAAAYVSKGRSSDELVEVIRKVAAGRSAAPPPPAKATPRWPHETLSDREGEVFRRLADG